MPADVAGDLRHHALGPEAAPALAVDHGIRAERALEGTSLARAVVEAADPTEAEVALEVDEAEVRGREAVDVLEGAGRVPDHLVAAPPDEPAHGFEAAAGVERAHQLRQRPLPLPAHAGVDHARGQALIGKQGRVPAAPHHGQVGTDPRRLADLERVEDGRARQDGDAEADGVPGQGRHARGRIGLQPPVHDHDALAGQHGAHVDEAQGEDVALAPRVVQDDRPLPAHGAPCLGHTQRSQVALRAAMAASAEA